METYRIGFIEAGNKRTDSPPGTSLSNLVAIPKSPLGGSFFSNPSLSILPNPFSSDTPVPFL